MKGKEVPRRLLAREPVVAVIVSSKLDARAPGIAACRAFRNQALP
jgi:hypothetical protein